MNKELLQIFKLFTQFKNLNKTDYIIDIKDYELLSIYWKRYKIFKHMSFSKFRKATIIYSLYSNLPLCDAVDDLCAKIELQQNGKRNK